MRRYLLDTAILTAYLRGRIGAQLLVDPWIARGESSTSVLVYGEIVEYFSGRPDERHRRRQLDDVLLDVFPYYLTLSMLDRYAAIRRQLRPPYGPGLVGDIDTLIAATAIEKGLTLVTSDSDFSRIPDLSLQLIPRMLLRT